MKFNYLILASLVSQPLFASEAEINPEHEQPNTVTLVQAQTPLIPTHDNQLLIEVQGEQYRSAIKIDLSDPNLILIIDTDTAQLHMGEAEEKNDVAEVEKELAESLNDEARSLALRLEAKKAVANGEYSRALELLDESEQMSESPAQVFAMKGSVLYKLKDMEGAIQAWKQAQKLDPSMTEVAEMLKWLDK